MPEYEFEDVDSKSKCSLVFGMRDAPPIGSVITHNGQRLKRLFSDVLVNSDPVSSRYPYLGRSIPCDVPELKKNGKGIPIVRGRKDEAMLRSKYELEKSR